MKCEICAEITCTDGFDGYIQFETTKRMFEKLVCAGKFHIAKTEWYEVCYVCNVCGTVWALAEPDFPVRGYLEQR